MAHRSDLIAADIDEYLAQHQRKGLLRFITCGSVDDGKSTLIGRMLYESHMVFEDHLTALAIDSKRVGTQGDDLDFALLLDGLQAEREQGITIDVAYRFFSTDKRTFIVADTPGHEQYTRNMVTGASTADVAVLLVDARKGVLTQTRRHSYLVHLLGIRTAVLAVNKMDLVDYDQSVFEAIVADYRSFAAQIGLTDITPIPISALRGDNLVKPSVATPWYRGPSLFEFLEDVDVADRSTDVPFRMPVQLVSRPTSDFRGLMGTVVAGVVRQGDPVRIAPGGRTSTVERVVTMDGDRPAARSGESITITLTDEIDASRGDVICAGADPVEVADQFECTVVWMADEALLPGRPYRIKLATRTVGATFGQPKHKVNVNTLEHLAARTLGLNDIGVINVALDRPIPFEPYASSRDLGGFIIIDRETNATLGAGLIHFSLRRSQNVHLQAVEVDRVARRSLNAHGSAMVWLTGLSGSGKSTIANEVERRLYALGVHTYLLDGDNVRHGLNRDLGFTPADRVENIRRVAEVGRLMVDAGLVVIAAFISPYRAERALARSLFDDGEFIEVHVDVPVDVAEQRDPKGLYRKARTGQLANFTGIDSPYEVPEHPDLHIDTTQMSADEAAELIIRSLRERQIIG